MLAKEGLKFNNFYTPISMCGPSRSVLYTGMSPIKNGSFLNHYPVRKKFMHNSKTLPMKTVIDHMKKAGYYVVLVGKGHVGTPDIFKWDKTISSRERDINFVEFKKFLSQNKDKKLCIFIASNYPHSPYPDGTPGNPYHPDYANKSDLSPFLKGYYTNIRTDQDQLQKVMNTLDDLGGRFHKSKTVFMYSSDHGISKKWTPSEESLKVPFVIRWPDAINNGNNLMTAGMHYDQKKKKTICNSYSYFKVGKV